MPGYLNKYFLKHSNFVSSRPDVFNVGVQNSPDLEGHRGQDSPGASGGASSTSPAIPISSLTRSTAFRTAPIEER